MALETNARRQLLSSLVLAAAVLATTGHRFANEFVYDDHFVIERGETIHDLSRIPDVFTHHTFVVSSQQRVDGEMPVDTYRPMTLLTFFWDAWLGGRATWPYHLTNLLLHLLCVLLLYRVTLTLVGEEGWRFALVSALAFALNPWTAGAHVWINGRSDMCALAFGLVATSVALGGVRSKARGLGLFLAFFCGLLSKEVLLGALPAIALSPMVRREQEGGVDAREALRTAAPLLAASGIYLVIRHSILGGMRTHSGPGMLHLAGERLPILLLDGLRASLLPAEAYLRSLSEEYALLPSWAPWLAWLLVAALLVVSFRVRRRWPTLLWAGLWFGGTLAPVAIITTVLWPGFGRYLYIPGAATAWVLATGLERIWPMLSERARRLGAAFALLYFAASAVFLVGHTSTYRDDAALYGNAIEMNPDASFGWGFLGMSQVREGELEAGIENLKQAAARSPGEQRYRARLAHALVDVGRREEAHAVALAGAADFADTPEEATFRLAAARSMTRRSPDEVVFHLVRCLDMRPGRVDCAEALDFLLERAPDAAANRAAHDALMRRRAGP